MTENERIDAASYRRLLAGQTAKAPVRESRRGAEPGLPKRAGFDGDGQPTVCSGCGKAIVKSHDEPLWFAVDDLSGVASSWHWRCRP